MHFSVSSTAMGTRDLQTPEDEVLAGPLGLTEREDTGRGQGARVFRERQILQKGQVAEADWFS